MLRSEMVTRFRALPVTVFLPELGIGYVCPEERFPFTISDCLVLARLKPFGDTIVTVGESVTRFDAFKFDLWQVWALYPFG